MQRVFGPAGVIDAFVQQRLMPLMDTSGPVWRWRNDSPLTSTLNPASPEEFAKARDLRDLLVGGLPLKVAVEKMGSEVMGVEISSGSGTQRFDRDSKGARPLMWTTQGQHEAYVEIVPSAPEGAKPVRIEAEGPWALFRLMERAKRENAGETMIRATFGEGAGTVTFLIQLPSNRNPFSRGALWSFRCPSVL
jgi:type VI secretion system protein ImpL